jgi:hypothetical protein
MVKNFLIFERIHLGLVRMKNEKTNAELYKSLSEKDLQILRPLQLLIDEQPVAVALLTLATEVARSIEDFENELGNTFRNKFKIEVPRIFAELQHIAGFPVFPVTNDGDTFRVSIELDIPSSDDEEEEEEEDQDFPIWEEEEEEEDNPTGEEEEEAYNGDA